MPQCSAQALVGLAMYCLVTGAAWHASALSDAWSDSFSISPREGGVCVFHVVGFGQMKGSRSRADARYLLSFMRFREVPCRAADTDGHPSAP
jgi:hypothetical protein